MITTEREQLYAAVVADPADDTVRLVYADWLDEHADHDRAEFVRAQIGDVWQRSGNPREKELQDAHPEWSQVTCPECGGKGVKSLVGYNPCRTCDGTGDLLKTRTDEVMLGFQSALRTRNHQYRRGFLDEVSCRLDEAMWQARLPSGLGARQYEWSPTPWALACVRTMPLTRFAVTDREPAESITGWWWLSPGVIGSHPAGVVPECVFRLLVDVDSRALTRSYETAEAAHDALARAVCSWVRGWQRSGGREDPDPRD